MPQPRRLMFRILAIVFSAALFTQATGCCITDTPRRYNIQIVMDKQLADTSVTVDIIGVNPNVAEMLSAKSVTDYFNVGDTTRTSVDKYSLRFSQDSPAVQDLSSKNPIWETWMQQGSTELIIMANLLGDFQDQPGAADTRREVLPLSCKRWGTDTIQIRVLPGLIRTTTPIKSADANPIFGMAF